MKLFGEESQNVVIMGEFFNAGGWNANYKQVDIEHDLFFRSLEIDIEAKVTEVFAIFEPIAYK